MVALLPLISVLVNALLTMLQGVGVGTPAITSLITSLESVVLPLVQTLTSGGQTKTSDALAVLGALSGVLTTLKTQTGIDPAVLTALNTLDQAVTSGLAAYVQAGKGIDLSVLTPISTIG